LGGPGRSVFATPAVAQDVAVFPLRNGELVGINLGDGNLRWRIPLEIGLKTRYLLAFNKSLLLSLSDERSLEQAGAGHLAALDPLTGSLVLLWQPQAPLLSPPALEGNIVLLRTSKGELVALELLSVNARQLACKLLWTQKLRAWWALPPFIAGETVVVADGRAMQGEGVLAAYNLADGAPLWTHPNDGLLAHLPVKVGETLVFRAGQHDLAALEFNDGKPLWKRQYTHIYSNLQATKSHVYLVVRGQAATGASGHYLLVCLDPLNNAVVWEAPLPHRVRVCQLAGEDTLWMGSDEGSLLACEIRQGTLLWQYDLGSNEDPIQTELVLEKGWLVAGTYAGKVAVFRATSSVEQVQDSQTLLEQGKTVEAAAAYALAGDFRRAAEIYAGELNEPAKAFMLYEHASLYAEAAGLAQKLGDSGRALKYYEQAGDLLGQANAHLSRGDEYEAARCFEQAGEYRQAAGLYEKVGQLRKALELYRRLLDLPAMLRLQSQALFSREDIEFLLAQEKHLEAAQAAVRAGYLEWAAKIFREAGENQKEYEILVEFSTGKSEPWALERLAELARMQGKFYQLGQVCERLGKSLEAAEAYHLAARQTEQVEADNKEKIASRYEQAMRLYDENGEHERYQDCWVKVLKYRLQPYVQVKGQAKQVFRELEMNRLDLVIKNVGYGVAHNIQIKARDERFEMAREATNVIIRHLGPGKIAEGVLYLRPKQSEIGEIVPLVLDWSWQDVRGQVYPGSATAEVSVKEKGSQTSETPQVINIGQLIQGDLIGGDKVEGDVQHGDRVEITHGEAGRLFMDGMEAPDQVTLCPTCHLPVSPEDQFCQACGNELKLIKKPKRKRS
jgi:outer membrane protein assembly factor BamB